MKWKRKTKKDGIRKMAVLAEKVEKGAQSQGRWMALETEKVRESDFFWSLWKECDPAAP